jgi:anaerobic selenocysteine-containing dehydrogenase
MLCEASCGLTVELEDDRVVSVRGDEEDPLSHGHICPKAAAIEDIRQDPDRVLEPLMRTPGGEFQPVPWAEALKRAGQSIARLQAEHGPDSVALYLGNPVVHNFLGNLSLTQLIFSLGTRSRFSATSLDQLPHMLASLLMLGTQAMLPVPDVDRTDLMIILGANPVVSNGSLLTAPGMPRRLKELRRRGGRVVVIDPRRTETAELADAHHFIRPGSDALFLFAMLQVLFAEGRITPGRLGAFSDGLGDLREAARRFTPERVAGPTGLSAEVIRGLARDFASTRRAVLYARVGACTQEFGGLTLWLSYALHAVTGHLDEEGGLMLADPAVDLGKMARWMGQLGSYGTYRSRVRGLPEFGGELPVVTLAEEIETEGKGRIRGLITMAGNPVLSAPNGERLDRALEKLDFMVSIDIYRNETTRHAHLILPSAFGFEKMHYDGILYAVAARNVAKLVPPLYPTRGQARDEYDIILDLVQSIGRAREGSMVRRLRQGGIGALAGVMRRLGQRGMLEMLLRTGPHRVNVAKLEAAPHGIDLGPLTSRLPAVLETPGKRLQLAPAAYLADVGRLESRLESFERGPEVAGESHGGRPLMLIGRRHLRSNNSWMHNSARLVKGKERCTLLMHPDDARARGVQTGESARVRSRVGTVVATVEVSDEMGAGVVSLPHGWGHRRNGSGPPPVQTTASAHPGPSVNDLTDDEMLDTLSGTAALNGVPVTVERL